MSETVKQVAISEEYEARLAASYLTIVDAFSPQTGWRPDKKFWLLLAAFQPRQPKESR